MILNNNFCEIIHNKDEFISLIIDTIESNLPEVTEIMVSIPIKNKKSMYKYSEKYFGNPYIHTENNKHKNICLVRHKNDSNKKSTNDINYVLKQANKLYYCTISAKLSDKSIKYLKNMCDDGFTKNKNGKMSQKEMAGNMCLKKINNELVHTIEINNDSIIYGEEFGVKIVDGIYNFHSHPRNAYKKYNVELGWPSAQDYIGFLLASIEDGTIFHLVISIEGIYIISLSKEWAIKKHSIDKKIGEFIQKNYNFCYKQGNTIEWYLNKVNAIIYKNNQLFTVQYLSWVDSHNIFTLPYTKIGDNCFNCDETKQLYDKFYS